MRKILLALALSSFAILTSCSSNNDPSLTETKTYNISFNVDGVITIVPVEENETLSIPDEPYKEGYTFIGWYTSPNCEEDEKYDFSKSVTSDFTLYAGFVKDNEPKLFTVTLELNGGQIEGETTFTINEGELVTKPIDPHKNGYRFDYWASDEALTTPFNFETTYITENITLYAKYNLIEVETLFDLTASSEADVTYRGDYAVDGNTETYWKASDESEQELIIDLGSVKEVSKVSQEFADLYTWEFKILGSIDGETYVPLIESDATSIGSKYERTLLGYYRYVKLEVPAQEMVATSKEFNVEYKDLEEGTNIAYGMKGVADCWGGGYESELMFDGNIGNYHCCNSPHDNHYMGIDTNTKYYVSNIELYFPNETDHKFFVDYVDASGQWITNDNLNYLDNTDKFGYLKIEINDIVSSMLIHYSSNSDGHWPALSEFKVNGFKINTDKVVNENVIDLGSLSYLSRIKGTNGDGLTFKTSSDGKNYKDVTPTVEGDYLVFNKECRYIQVEGSGVDLNALEVYSKSYYRNLAILTSPVATSRSDDQGFWENAMVFDKNCKSAAGRFWCAKDADTTETITLDLGIDVLANNIVYKYQDLITDRYVYQLKIYVSENGVDYTNVLDTTANENQAESGQLFKADLTEENNYFRYLKIETRNIGGWVNCNTLEINGIGSPII